MKFGDNLRMLRKAKKLSQEDLAEKMRVSRQSVSKWETGDAYPEMNNILELCKIFKCKINDLVNDSIIDLDLLDDEVKMSVVKFKKEKQNKMKALSKAISIIARIGRIVSIVCIPIVVVSMILTGICMSKVDIVNDKIVVSSANDNMSIVETNDKIVLKINNVVITDASVDNVSKMKDIMENNSKIMVIGYVETGFIFLIIALVLVSKMCKSLEKLFNNINKGDTPFTLENVTHIKKIAFFMIILTIVPNLCGVIFEVLFKTDLGIDFELFSIVEILVLFSIAYIFEYGYEIQLDSKGKMYGEVDE